MSRAVPMPRAAKKGYDVTIAHSLLPPRDEWLTWLFVTLAIFVTAVCAFVTFDPVMVTAGLDPSWRYAINEAAARRIPFGGGLAFTYGPYAAVFTRTYHPELSTLVFIASAYLAFAYAVGLRSIAPRSAVLLPLVLCLCVAFVAGTSDALLLSCPFVGTLVTLRIVGAEASPSRPALVALALMSSASGLLVLIKGTMIVACAASALLNGTIALQRRKRSVALIVWIVPVVSMLFFWLVIGQPLSALGGYFAWMLPTIAGYSEAMALSGEALIPGLFFLAALSLVASIAWIPSMPRTLRAFLAASLCLYFLLAFKGSYVRHDMEHGFIAFGFILVCAIALLMTQRSPSMSLAALAVFGAWALAEFRTDPLFHERLIGRTTAPYRQALTGLVERWKDPAWPKSQFDKSVATIARAHPLPRLDGPVDLYSYEQSALIASGNIWSPRPVLQSYAAYNSSLAALNATHLAGPDAPAHVFFKVQPIDRRLPALEDGCSWPILLSRYEPRGVHDGFLLLARNAKMAMPVLTAVVQPSASFGESVKMPIADGPLYFRLNIVPTWRGRVRKALFRTSRLMIDIRLSGGRQRRFVLIPEMARSTMLLSPLVETTDDFAHLYTQWADSTNVNVESFAVRPADPDDDNWNARFTWTLMRPTSGTDGRGSVTCGD